MQINFENVIRSDTYVLNCSGGGSRRVYVVLTLAPQASVAPRSHFPSLHRGYFLLVLLPPPCLADLLLHPREQPADSQRLALFKFAPNVLFLLLLPPLCFTEHLPHPQCLPGAQRRRRHRIASSLHFKSTTPQRFFYSSPE